MKRLGVLIILICGYFTGIIPAAIEGPFAGGSGTTEDPYQVGNSLHLDHVRYYLNSHFRQIADIDLADYSEGWEPVGINEASDFTGSYDGNDYRITSLVINPARDPDANVYAGLFGYTGPGAELFNITLEDVEVFGLYASGLVSVNNHGSITNCSVTGIIDTPQSHPRGVGIVGGIASINYGFITNSTAGISGSAYYVGGLAGINGGTVTNSSISGNISGGFIVGGLVGWNWGEVHSSYTAGSVSGETSAGGLVAENTGIIADCYSTAAVSGHIEVGGLVGSNYEGTIRSCYAAGPVFGEYDTGGLVGKDVNGNINLSYYDYGRTGQTDIGKGIPKPTGDLIKRSTFYFWDFSESWAIIDGKTMPYFPWQDTVDIIRDFAVGSGTEDDPYLVETAEQLNSIHNYLNDHFRQAEDIDLGIYSEGEGFIPIGIYELLPFTGSYNGNGFRIINLFINRPQPDQYEGPAYTSFAGLFNCTGNGARLLNIRLEDVEITGYIRVAGLAGINAEGSIITNCYVSGTFISSSVNFPVYDRNWIVPNPFTEKDVQEELDIQAIGGITAWNAGTVTNCSSDISFSGDLFMGGLVGCNEGTISDISISGEFTVSHASFYGSIAAMNRGTITGCSMTGIFESPDAQVVGGITAWNQGIIENSSADIVASARSYLGGLTGINEGVITGCSAVLTGNGAILGGLAGYNAMGSIINSSGYVSGSGQGVGGIAGYNEGGSITGCYSPGDIIAPDAMYAGGITAMNTGVVTDCYVPGAVSAGIVAGGVAGFNAGIISTCYTAGPVSTNKASFDQAGTVLLPRSVMQNQIEFSGAGGIAGINRGNINESYATGHVTGFSNVGGLAGMLLQGSITNSYASGNVKGVANVGGLAGILLQGSITNCYAVGYVSGERDTGGLAGLNFEGSIEEPVEKSTIDSSYYDYMTAMQIDTGNGIPRSTEDMMKQATFAEWDFEGTWAIIENATYPYLQWVMADEEYASVIDSFIIPALYKNQHDAMMLTFRNTGTHPWETGTMVCLGAAGDHDPIAEQFRVALQHDVLPGQLHTFIIDVYPAQTGKFTTEWQMLKEGEFWFGEIFSREVEVTVRTGIERQHWELLR